MHDGRSVDPERGMWICVAGSVDLNHSDLVATSLVPGSTQTRAVPSRPGPPSCFLGASQPPGEELGHRHWPQPPGHSRLEGQDVGEDRSRAAASIVELQTSGAGSSAGCAHAERARPLKHGHPGNATGRGGAVEPDLRELRVLHDASRTADGTASQLQEPRSPPLVTCPHSSEDRFMLAGHVPCHVATPCGGAERPAARA